MPERETMTDRVQPPSPGDSPIEPPRVGGETLHDGPLVHDHLGPDTLTPQSVHDPSLHGGPAVIGSAQPMAVGTLPDVQVSGQGIPSSGGRARIGDRVFAALTSGASAFVIVLVILIGAFLVIKSVPSIADDKANFLTSTDWSLSPGNLHFGVASLLWVTVAISVLALLLAMPVAVGIALFVTHYAPRSVAKPVAYVVDLLAAIPSIVYGIWGVYELSPKLTPVQDFLSHIPLPLFDNKQATGTIFDGGVVLAVMILPIITAISRDVFERTPRANIEAALALGATKWEMIRMAVLPYGRPGVISGAMLGLGRALGETVAIYLILSTTGKFSFSIFSGGSTFASQIALGSAEFNNPKTTGAYIAAGLVLFVLTFLVNSAARAVVNRRKDFV